MAVADKAKSSPSATTWRGQEGCTAARMACVRQGHACPRAWEPHGVSKRRRFGRLMLEKIQQFFSRAHSPPKSNPHPTPSHPHSSCHLHSTHICISFYLKRLSPSFRNYTSTPKLSKSCAHNPHPTSLYFTYALKIFKSFSNSFFS